MHPEMPKAKHCQGCQFEASQRGERSLCIAPGGGPAMSKISLLSEILAIAETMA